MAASEGTAAVPPPLSPELLTHRCDPRTLGFASTAEVEPLDAFVGQPRAVRAVDLALSIAGRGYNIFATGPAGTGRRTILEALLRERAASRPAPPDVVYVFDFAAPQSPRALTLAPGQGRRLAEDMEAFVAQAREQIPLAFESSSYEERHRQLHDSLSRRREEVVGPLRQEALKRGLSLQLTPTGLLTVPIIRGQPATPDELAMLPEPVRDRYMRGMEEMREPIAEAIRQLRRIEREARDAHLELDREVGEFAAGHLVDELKARWSGNDAVLAWLDDVRADMIAHLGEFRAGAQAQQLPPMVAAASAAFFRRYAVNCFVSNDPDGHAPVVVESITGYYDVFGRIEYEAAMGAFATDHLHLRAGALHRANGGFLILQALEVLRQPFVWDRLKEALRRGRVRLEHLGAHATLFPTATLEPEELDLDVKVVLVGPTEVYRLLLALDEEARGLFRIRADFADRMSRAEGIEQYARFVSRETRDAGLPPFSAEAVARLVEHGSRLAGHRDRLTTRFGPLAEVVTEAAEWARRAGRDVVAAEDVRRALDERAYRSNLVEERLREMTAEGALRIERSGAVVGQVNGLSVLELGDHAFGHPVRVSASVAPGDGTVVNIDREVELSGPIHDKGFLILAGFLRARFARERPLSLRASLVFEQSYAPHEGDSASAAELCALLSALADVPLRQDVAITGSVDQHGRIQAVGGVNEKIEGFFDVVGAAERHDGTPGVVIPRATLSQLMLRDEVVDAAAAGRFAVWAVDSIEECLAVLTGRPAAAVLEAVQARVDAYAEAADGRREG
jgi:lon-related putative ATP-dependent protease